MRTLLLTHSFNSLAQRLFVALHERGHEVSVEVHIRDWAAKDAVQPLAIALHRRRATA